MSDWSHRVVTRGEAVMLAVLARLTLCKTKKSLTFVVQWYSSIHWNTAEAIT
jgi:hypothetical protein